MKISMVTTSFNQARFLDEAMMSVVRQTHRDVEYIVVDPGSTDGSRDIIERHGDHIDHVAFEPDAGPADGLNHGFAKATGDVYGFLNADDILDENALHRVAHAFECHRNVDVISAHGWLIDESGHRFRRAYSDRHTVWRYAYRGAYLLQQSTFFRAEAFQRAGGFNAENQTCWDGELWLDMALAGCRFKVVPEFWSSFRFYEGSLSSSIAGRSTWRLRYEEDRARLFHKAIGRDPAGIRDQLMRGWARVLKWSTNPIAFADRCLSRLDVRARRCPI